MDEKKKLSDLFLDKDYIEFYGEHKRKQDNITRMIDGNICRICVCEDEIELFRQYYSLHIHLQELLHLQRVKFDKQEELGYERKLAECLETLNERRKGNV